MSKFQLTIELSAEDTSKLNSEGFMIAIVRGKHTPDSIQPIWNLLSPFETNVLAWDNTYGLYASHDPIEVETVITASSTQYPAQQGVIYPFQNNVFGDPSGATPPNTFATINKTTEAISFGLLQTIISNGTTYDERPVTVASLSVMTTGTFEPSDDVSVFLYQKVENGTIVAKTEGPVLVVDTATEPMQTIHYNGEVFVKGSLTLPV